MSIDNSNPLNVASQQGETAMSGVYLVIAAGKDTNQGKRVSVPLVEGGLVPSYVSALNRIPVLEEAWWTPHFWNGDRRAKSNWTSSWGIGIDFDWEDPHSTWIHPVDKEVDTHCPIPKEVVWTLNEDARNKKMPGNGYYSTPRGIRVFSIFPSPVADLALFKSAAKGAVATFQKYLLEKGLYEAQNKAGLRIDTCFDDVARLFYAPRAIVDGVKREGWAVELQRDPFDPVDLSKSEKDYLPPPPKPKKKEKNTKSAPGGVEPGTPPKKTKKTTPASLDDADLEEFAEARQRANVDFLARRGPFPTSGTGKCPICGWGSCFGQLKDEPFRAYCFNSDHVSNVGVEVGSQKDGSPGWVFDGVDILMFEAGVVGKVKPGDFLRELKDQKGKPYYQPRITDEIIWVRRLQSFLTRLPDGSYDLDYPCKRETAIHHLVERGIRPKRAKTLIARSAFKKIDSFGNDPDEKPFYEKNGITFVNKYVPPTLQATRGKFPSIAKMLYMLSGKDAAGVKWLFNWIAAKVQRPGERGLVATILVGPQGCGKGALGEFIREMVGTHNSATIGGKDLADEFTSRYAACLFVNVAELSVPGERQDILDKLKILITEPDITFKVPFAPRVAIENRLTFLAGTNEEGSLRIQRTERRYSVFHAPNDEAQEGKAYWNMVKGLFNPETKTLTSSALEELQGFYGALKARNVDWGMASRRFENEARLDQIEVTKKAHETFFDMIEGAENNICPEMQGLYERFVSQNPSLLVEKAHRPDGIACRFVYNAYLQHAKEEGQRYTLAQNAFGGAWKARFGKRYEHKKARKQPRVWIYEGLYVSQGPYLELVDEPETESQASPATPEAPESGSKAP